MLLPSCVPISRVPLVAFFSGPTILPNFTGVGIEKFCDIIPEDTNSPVKVLFFKLLGSLSLDLACSVERSTFETPP